MMDLNNYILNVSIPKDTLLIDKHKEWCKTGRMDCVGLCYALRISELNPIYRRLFESLFTPTVEEFDDLEAEGLSIYYWASGLEEYNLQKYFTYTPLRQNIVLMICAMVDEL